MSSKYRIGHRSARQRRKLIIAVLVCTFLIVGAASVYIIQDLRKSGTAEIAGTSRTVTQVLGDSNQRLTIDDPLFTMELPADWKETGRKNTQRENSISWQATKKNEDNRYFTIYIDKIPQDKAVNRLLPLNASGNTLTYGQLSDKCESFTGGGTTDAGRATQLKETKSKWQNVDFICDLPRIVDNEIGTGSTEGINIVTVTGPTKGQHKYFFLYIDRNIRPDYSILYDAIRSFRAK